MGLQRNEKLFYPPGKSSKYDLVFNDASNFGVQLRADVGTFDWRYAGYDAKENVLHVRKDGDINNPEEYKRHIAHELKHVEQYLKKYPKLDVNARKIQIEKDERSMTKRQFVEARFEDEIEATRFAYEVEDEIINFGRPKTSERLNKLELKIEQWRYLTDKLTGFTIEYAYRQYLGRYYDDNILPFFKSVPESIPNQPSKLSPPTADVIKPGNDTRGTLKSRPNNWQRGIGSKKQFTE